MKRSEIIEMIRRVVQEKKRTNEAKIVPAGFARVLPLNIARSIDQDIIDDGFGNEYSGFDLYSTIEETYAIEDYEDDSSTYFALNEIFKLFPAGGTFASNNILNYFEKAPGAPFDSFTSVIHIGTLDDKFITVEVPFTDEPYNKYNVGWFDSRGNYFPDTKNFDEKGNYIGDGA